jgi:hypothetical protein
MALTDEAARTSNDGKADEYAVLDVVGSVPSSV